MANVKKSKIASVLSFEKKMVPSDGFFYGTRWKSRYDHSIATPLNLQEKSVRGTISNRLKETIKGDPVKLNAEVEKANLQRVDSCALGEKQDTLNLRFTLKFLSGVQNPSSCNNREFNATLTAAVEDYIKEYNFMELSLRYALNIANARFLWRNRVGADDIEVHVKVLNKDTDKSWIFNSYNYNINSFSYSDEKIVSLQNKIAEALSGKDGKTFLLLEINAFCKMGYAQDVYPSEELVLSKGASKNSKSKILYQINEVAGMHSQKLGNALRSIDTWYPNYDSLGVGPIASEPYGSVTTLGKAFRSPGEKSDFYTLFDTFSIGEPLKDANDKHYVMSILVRGGVFGDAGKD